MKPISNVWIALLLLVTFGLYAAAIDNDYTCDDFDVVHVPARSTGSPNTLVAELRPISEYLTTCYTDAHGGYGRGFRPISVLSFALVHELSEYDDDRTDEARLARAWWQHLVNVLLHVAGVWLTFLLIALFFGRGLPAFLGAGVFAVHALRSDPVISMVGRCEIMAFVWGAAATLLYVQALRSAGGARWWRLGTCALLMFLAFGSKENAIPWVVMAPLTVFALRWQGGDAAAGLPDWRGQALPWCVGVAIPAAVFLALLFNIWGDLDAAGREFEPRYNTNPLWYMPDPQRWANGIMLLGYGCWKTILPLHLNIDYGHKVFDLAAGFGDLRVLAALVALGGWLGAGLILARRQPTLLIAVAYFFGFTFLISNIPLPIEAIFGERHYYAPAVATSFLVALAAMLIRTPTARKIGTGVFVLWVITNAVLIQKRNADWVDEPSVLAADFATQPRSFRLLLSATSDLRETRDMNTLHRTLMQAYALDPHEPDILWDLSEFHLTMREFDLAERFAREGMRSKHIDVRDRKGDFQHALARVYKERGNTREAESWYRKAIAAAAGADPRKRLELGLLYLQSNRPAAGLRELHQTTIDHPTFPPAWVMLVDVLQREKNQAALAEVLQRALTVEPSARLGLCEALAIERNEPVARQVVERSLRAGLPPAMEGPYRDLARRLGMNTPR